MKRYEGVGLPKGGRIAVVANDAIGNFVVATPLLQMLRRELQPLSIDYYGGTRTREFEEASDLFEWSYPLHGAKLQDAATAAMRRIEENGPYNLIVNNESTAFAKAFTALLSSPESYVVGPCLAGGRGDLPFAQDDRGDLAGDMNWIDPDLRDRYPFLKSSFIAEIFCRLAYLEGDVPLYKVPSHDPDSDLPHLIIATSASLPEKLWPAESWETILRRLRERGVTVGLVGAKPSAQAQYWKGNDLEQDLVAAGLVEDLRGMYTLPQVVGLLEKVCLVLTLDNGILHLAAAAQTPTVGLFREGIHRLWAPPYDGLKVLTHAPGETVADISPDAVWEALRDEL